MKKLVSMILAVMLIISATVCAFAQENSKISSDLAVVLESKNPDEFVDIYIWTNYHGPNATQMPSWPDKGQARAELEEHYDNWFMENIDAVVLKDIEYKEVIIFSGIIIVSVKAGDVEKIVNHDIVREVSYFENYECENEAVKSFYLNKLFEHYPRTQEAYGYGELIYKEIGEADIDYDDAIDYAVIFAHFALAPDAIDNGVIGGRYFYSPQLYSPFRFGYAVYDLDNDKFIELDEGVLTDYPFVECVMEQLSIGTPFGDADGDNALSVMDATLIQRCIAGLDEYKKGENLWHYGNYPTNYRSDYNLDGVVDVFDATGIQQKIAQI